MKHVFDYRFFQLPCVQQSEFLYIFDEIHLNNGLIDWLHFSNDRHSLINQTDEEEMKTPFQLMQRGNERLLLIKSSDDVMLFWELLKQRFLVDSEARCYIVVFMRNNTNLDPQVVTCSERCEELRLIIDADSVYLRRSSLGSHFTSGLGQFLLPEDRKIIDIKIL